MYSTVEQFHVAFPKLSSVTSATAALYLANASSLIDGKLSGYVTVPVSPIPQVLANVERDLAWVMYLRRHVAEAAKMPILDQVWREANDTLDDIRAGKISLVVSGTDLSPTDLPWSSVRNYTPTFGARDIEDAVVDQDRIDDEFDAST